MCGFLSIDSSEYPMAIFDKALHELDDRGPDMTRTQEANGAVFGFNRLSIMDLSEKGCSHLIIIIAHWFAMAKSTIILP